MNRIWFYVGDVVVDSTALCGNSCSASPPFKPLQNWAEYYHNAIYVSYWVNTLPKLVKFQL